MFYDASGENNMKSYFFVERGRSPTQYIFICLALSIIGCLAHRSSIDIKSDKHTWSKSLVLSLTFYTFIHIISIYFLKHIHTSPCFSLLYTLLSFFNHFFSAFLTSLLYRVSHISSTSISSLGHRRHEKLELYSNTHKSNAIVLHFPRNVLWPFIFSLIQSTSISLNYWWYEQRHIWA